MAEWMSKERTTVIKNEPQKKNDSQKKRKNNNAFAYDFERSNRIDNVFAYDFESSNRMDKRRNILLALMSWTISGRKEWMPQEKKEE